MMNPNPNTPDQTPDQTPNQTPNQHSPNPYAPDSRLSEPTGPLGVQLLDVFGPDSPFLPRVLELFWDLFPKYRRYLEYIRACALRHTPDHPHAVGHVWAVYDPSFAGSSQELEQDSEQDLEQELEKLARGIIGFQIFNYVAPQRGGGGFGLGAFRGLLEGYRHHGIGTWLARNILEQAALDAHDRGDLPPIGYVSEVEPLANTQKREIFAQKTGSILLEGEYLEPPMVRGVTYIKPELLLGVAPKLMQLVFYPNQPTALLSPLSPEETCALLEGVYLDYYLLEPGDPLFSKACRSLEEKLELITTGSATPSVTPASFLRP
jgi:GNAT superfamily N-acetyltransferase